MWQQMFDSLRNEHDPKLQEATSAKWESTEVNWQQKLSTLQKEISEISNELEAELNKFAKEQEQGNIQRTQESEQKVLASLEPRF